MAVLSNLTERDAHQRAVEPTSSRVRGVVAAAPTLTPARCCGPPPHRPPLTLADTPPACTAFVLFPDGGFPCLVVLFFFLFFFFLPLAAPDWAYIK